MALEKRKHPRIPLDSDGWHAEIKNQLDGKVLGQVVNLSLGGMMVIASPPLAAEALYQIELIANAPTGTVQHFSAGVMVLWSTEAQSANAAWAGMQIIDISEGDRTRLAELADLAGQSVASDA